MFRIGTGFDVHAFKAGNSVKLCGVELPFNKSLAGHSDADVALHALTDAILGALALGDIGLHFPDKDDKWKEADSVIFLNWSIEQARQRNLKLSNIDLTIICEKVTGNKIKFKRQRKTSIYDIPYYLTDNFYITKTYKWSPKKNIMNIVKDTYKWLIENKKELIKTHK